MGAIWRCFEAIARAHRVGSGIKKGSAGALPSGIDVGAGLYVPLPPS
jgi:hypothetical protein